MAIYTPKQVPSRPKKKGGKLRNLGRWIGEQLRRPQKTMTFQPQATVTGTQQVQKLKQFTKNILLIVGGICGLLAVLWVAFQLVLQSDIFRLNDIRITGASTLTERQVLDLAGIEVGGSLVKLNPKNVEARIAAHPWVESAKVKPQWPSALDITIREYQPFALVNIEENKEKHLRYVSKEGHIFAEIGPGQELDYPVITGAFQNKDIVANRFVKGSLAEAACTVLLLASKGNAILPLQSVSEVHIDAKQGLIVYLIDRPFPVYFGKDRLQTKYFRLVKVLEQLYAKKQMDAVKEIRMDYADDKVLVTGAKIDG